MRSVEEVLKNYKYSLIRNDFVRNKAINLTLFVFLFISALLMATGVLVIQRLSGSVDQIMDVTNPPHFLQMHVGEFEREQVEDFVLGTGLVSQYQVQDMANIEGIHISYIKQDDTRGNLADSLLDNYFVKQNESFDYLVDLDNQIVELLPGEIGLPLIYAKRTGIEPGDRIVIQQAEKVYSFTVKTILRDAQMGSSLSGSIRFLLHPMDFEELYSHAMRQESIIGVRLHEEGDIGKFESLYKDEANKMPQNGVSITYPLIKLVNTIGDGLMSGVIIIVSLVLIVISLITMRFTVLSTLEDEVREIGVLRAVGLRKKDVNSLYQMKYRIIALVACLMAALASFGLGKVFMSNISLNFGLSRATPLSYLLPFLTTALIYIIVMFSLGRVLKIVSKMNVLSALREGKIVRAKDSKKQRDGRLSRLFQNPETSLGLLDLRINTKSWLVLMMVLLLCSMIILVPLNIYSTLSSPDFIRFLGASRNDVRVAIQYQPELEDFVREVREASKSDPEIELAREYQSFRGMAESENGWQTLLMESGDYSEFPIEMASGRLPGAADEMAVSLLNQEKFGLSLGDIFPVKLGQEIVNFQIVGVYQDITNGGYTTKVVRQVDQDILEYAFYLNLVPGADHSAFVDRWSEDFKQAKVLLFKEMISQTVGTITSSLLYALSVVFVLSLIIISLIAVLYISLRMYKQYQEDATLLALGFTKTNIRNSYLLKSALVIFAGVLLGASITLVLGEPIMGAIFAIFGFGITSMNFIIEPIWFALLGCLSPAAIALGAIAIMTSKVDQVTIMNMGNI